MDSSLQSNGTAPTYDVPEARIVSIEHPCIVKNFDNAFKSLGGEHQIKHVLRQQKRNDRLPPNHAEPVVGVSLKPDDPFAKKLSSTAAPTQNMLIKVTVPKRTRKKRKRGTDEPFVESDDHPDNPSITSPELLQRLRDNEGRYSIQVVGTIEETHRFNHPPDFQFQAEPTPIMREMRDHATHLDYDRLKAFNINFNPDITSSATLPAPPAFFPPRAPHTHDHEPPDPKPTPKPTRKKRPRDPSPSSIPTSPPPNLPKPDPTTQTTIENLTALLTTRPILSTRLFNETHPTTPPKNLSLAIPHIGYKLTTGPWAHTIIPYGTNPYLNPAMRIYQTVLCIHRGLDPTTLPPAHRAPAGQTHVFDGKTLGIDGPGTSARWQLCDLVDPTLQNLVHTANIRGTCEREVCGWYHNGTLAKLTRIFRDKVGRLVRGGTALEEGCYEEVVAGLPDVVMEKGDCVLDGGRREEVVGLCQAVGVESMRLKGLAEGGKAKRNGVDVEGGAEGEGDGDEADGDGDGDRRDIDGGDEGEDDDADADGEEE